MREQGGACAGLEPQAQGDPLRAPGAQKTDAGVDGRVDACALFDDQLGGERRLRVPRRRNTTPGTVWRLTTC